jgi:hypothetical protein
VTRKVGVFVFLRRFMSNTNQNFEDSGGFGQDEVNQKIMKMIYTINLSKNVEIEDRSQYLNIPLNSIGNLPMNDILKILSK